MKLATTLFALALSLTFAPRPPLAGQDLEVIRGPSADWIERDGAVQLELNRPPEPADGRIALMLDETDVTDLLRVEGAQLTYRSDVLALPGGVHSVAVFLVSERADWTEIYRSEIKVRRRGGIEDFEISHGVELQGLWLAERGGNDESSSSSGDEGANGQLTHQARLTKNGWSFSSQLDLLAVTEVERALRFSEDGDDAEQVDLSAYSVRLERGRGFLELGDLSYGEHQHLITGFRSRGLNLGLPLGRIASLNAAVVNGSSIVGWDNFSGLSDSRHQLAAGSVGTEFVPKRPGALRLDADVVDASIRPLNDFGQGGITDAEDSSGWGARLSAGAGKRVRVQLGFARSRFSNPLDSLLSQGSDLVAVLEEERDARYATIHLSLVERELSDGQPLSVNLSLQHERVDPQYRSVGAFAQADLLRNGLELQASVGPISAQLGHSRSEDNLADIESILKTKTERSNFNVALPLAMMFDETPRPWLPDFRYGLDVTHQFGANDPVNGGFNPSHIPDQESENHSAGLDWSGNRWQAGYGLDYSHQDNRQPGREADDFNNLSHNARLSVSPHAKLDLGVEWSRSRAASLSVGRLDRSERTGLNSLWRPTGKLTLSGSYSFNEVFDEPFTNRSETTILNLELGYRVAVREGRKHGGSGQFFLRYASQDFESLDGFFGGFVIRDSWTLHAGFNLSLR